MSAAPFSIKRGQQGILFGYTITAALPGLRVPDTFYGDDRAADGLARLLNDTYAAGAAAQRDGLAIECIEAVAIGCLDDEGLCVECKAEVGEGTDHAADCLTIRARADRAARPGTAKAPTLFDKSQVIEAWACVRKNNHSIPDEALDAMRAVLLASIGGAA